MEVIKLDWDACRGACDRFVENTPLKPKIIIGITRGGVIPASFVHRAYSDAQFISTAPRTLEDGFIDAFGPSVLLIDDIYDTGKTIDRILSHSSYKIDVFTLCTKQPNVSKRYHGILVPDDVWVQFPWEKEVE